jgi:beta-phosphoglucomutase
MMFGCIFDCDGVIVDSSGLHIEAWKQLAREEDLVFPVHLFKKSFGMKNEQIIPHLFRWTSDIQEIKRLDARKELLFRELVGSRGAATFPGVELFLSLLYDQEIPCVIGSSAPRANVIVALESLGFGVFFKAIVSGEDAALGKPDPQIFLTAARALEKTPGECVVFEDAHIGIAAARAGGMKVVAVANTFPRASLHEADCVVDRLDQLTLVRLKHLLNPEAINRRAFP